MTFMSTSGATRPYYGRAGADGCRATAGNPNRSVVRRERCMVAHRVVALLLLVTLLLVLAASAGGRPSRSPSPAG